MKKLILLVSLTFVLTACPESPDNSKESSDLPENPEGFVFRWHNGGGMINQSWNAFICEDSAYWTYNRYGQETTLRWIPETEEFEQFYKDLKNQNFNKIESDCEGEVFDRGGNTINIDVEGESYKIDNSGNCFINEESAKNYGMIMSIMNNYLDNQIQKQLLPVEIESSEALLNSGFDIRISTDSYVDKGNYTFNKDTTIRVLELYPGYNQLTIRLDYKDSSDYYGSPVNFIYDEYFEEIDQNTNSILVDWKDGKILLDLY